MVLHKSPEFGLITALDKSELTERAVPHHQFRISSLLRTPLDTMAEEAAPVATEPYVHACSE